MSNSPILMILLQKRLIKKFKKINRNKKIKKKTCNVLNDNMTQIGKHTGTNDKNRKDQYTKI